MSNKLVKKRDMLKASIVALLKYTATRPADITVQDIEVRIQRLEKYWTEILDVHLEILVLTGDAEIEFQNLELANLEDIHDKTKAKLSAWWYTLQPTRDEATGSSSQYQRQPQQVVATANSVYETKLPNIELPKFNGKYENWQSFHDMFLSQIDGRARLKDAEKLYYLKMSLEGDAAQIIRSYQLTNANYQIAWNALKDRYNNKRLIVTAHFKTLFGQKLVANESAASLRNLIDTSLECIRALNSLELPTDDWDCMLVFIISQKLDAETHKQWELSLAHNNLPTLNELTTFIEKRCRSLEAVVSEVKPNYRKQTENARVTNSRSSSSHHVSRGTCIKCNSSEHLIIHCVEFTDLSVSDRTDFVRKNNLCFNCLRQGHTSFKCLSSKCRRCNRNHNTLLHYEQAKKSFNAEVPMQQDVDDTQSTELSLESASSSSVNNLFGNKIQSSNHQILLATAMVIVETPNKQLETVRVLLDSGSQASFITERCVQRLRLNRRSISVPINGLGASAAGHASSMASFKIKSCVDSAFILDLDALVLNKLTGQLPTNELSVRTIPKFSGITLADPQFFRPGDIDILLGADAYGKILLNGIIPGQPTAQNTRLGWVLFGPVSTDSNVVSNVVTINLHLELMESLRKFWTIEEIGDVSTATEEETRCEQFFRENHYRNDCGRYVVKLPFKDPMPNLGNSYQIAHKRFIQIENRLERNPIIKRQYDEFMAEYSDLGHMQLDHSPDENVGYYIPHHFVQKADSSTTKLRVVFDASCKTSNGLSLNENQLVGSKLQDDLSEILLRFRRHKVGVVADIAKMYRQVLVDPSDRKYQKILWRGDKKAEPPRQWILNTVTYGMAAAPFLAIRSLRQLALDEGANFPLASATVLSDFYVDDMITGFDNENIAVGQVKELTELLNCGGLDLRKWASNSEMVMKSIPEEKREINSVALELNEQNVVKTLGMFWKPSRDYFCFKINVVRHNKVTKRTILSDISKLYDPLGLVSPTVILAKILMQRLWTSGVGWDDEIPESIAAHWREFSNTLHSLDELEIPRWLGTNKTEPFEIHAFCDASESAYAACIYLKTISEKSSTRLVVGKTKVAPTQQVSLPRLELCSAVLLTKLLKFTQKTFKLENVQYYAWTDSQIVLAWLRKLPRNWKTFVANRISYIQSNTLPDRWRHVPSQHNPADCASRGIMPALLLKHELWWTGPVWLNQSESNWPTLSCDSVETDLELKKTLNILISAEVPMLIDNLLCRYSSFSRLKLVTAYIIRFTANLRREKSNRACGFLTTAELQGATEYWVKFVQSNEFGAEIQSLKANKEIPRRSRLLTLRPFLDDRGLLRVGGRLSSNVLSKPLNPLILPQKNPLIDLIVADAHLRLLHGGVKLCLDHIRRTYWIIGARCVVRRHVHKCNICFRQRPKTNEQLMGSLPAVRITPARPFLRSGVDYAGPILLKSKTGRGSRTIKGYIALFICFVTKAVHVEIVSDMTTNAFLAAFRRFISRRGRCADLFSDCGSNFVGAQRELGVLLKATLAENSIPKVMAEEGTNWHFIPPGAPHVGGLWEAGIKSVKHHLRRIVGQTKLTFEEMATTLAEIEACLNSRPLCAQSDDPDDISALTPGHFLVGDSLMVLPEPNVTSVPVNRLTRWQLTKQLSQHFWYRWRMEYLSTLQQRPKWFRPRVNVEVGQLALIKDERFPPGKWPLARVIAVKPGKDGLVRTVSLKHHGGVTERCIQKICILPNQ